MLRERIILLTKKKKTPIDHQAQKVNPENICPTLFKLSRVYLGMNTYVYTHTYVHVIQLAEKVSMNLKKSKDCGKVWRKKGKEEKYQFYYNLQKYING